MYKNKAKESLKKGQAVLGAFCSMPSPLVAEVFGYAGFDFIIIDAEHGIQDYETCEHMIRASEVTGMVPVTRVGLNMQQHILRFLDAGTIGLQIPLVNNKADAISVVNSAKYPPVGKRGLAPVRAANYGLSMPIGDYVKMANEELLVVAQVETMEAVANLKDILSVDGIDVVFLGPSDLSSSMGLAGQTTHHKVIEVIERCGKQIVAAGKVAGTIGRDYKALVEWRSKGFNYLCANVVGMIGESARSFAKGFRGQ